MSRLALSVLCLTLVAVERARGAGALDPDVVERGRKATAMVEIPYTPGWTGSAFCVDKSGLFLTNRQAVEKVLEKGSFQLVLDPGQERQRRVRAKVLRHDDATDLALLQVDNDLSAEDLKQGAGAFFRALTKPREELVLTPLELGPDTELVELTEIATFGYPLFSGPASSHAPLPAVTVISGHITALRKDKGRLLGVQIDSQLNPGHAGGPVVDASGKVIGMVEATVSGTAMNLATPAYRLADFLAAPGIGFEPPSLTKPDRTHPVTWTIQLTPPTPRAKLPEGTSVAVTLTKGVIKPRTYQAIPSGDSAEAARGIYKVTLDPFEKNLERGVELSARFAGRGPPIRMHGNDREIKIGDQTFKLSDIKVFNGGPSPRARTASGKTVVGPIDGLGQVETRVGLRKGTLELNEATEINVEAFDIVGQQILAVVEVKRGPKVVATSRKWAKFAIDK